MNNTGSARKILLTVGRPDFRRHYLSASLGLMCTMIPNAASASTPQHSGAFGGHPMPIMPGNTGTAGNSWTSFAVHGMHNGNQLGNQQANQHSNQHGLILPGKAALFTLPNSPASLDLGSGQSNFLLSGLSNVQTLTITVGGKSEVVGLNTRLTGAELVAADQVMSSGHQTLTVNGLGVATGGVFTLSNQSLTAIDSSLGSLNALAVPHNVRVIDTMSNLQLSGDLVNSGHIVVQSSTAGGATIQAYDIINNTGATISTAGQSGHAANLTLIADHQLVNGGNITAANNLNITAPLVTNTGTLKATAGNVNFDSTTAATINNEAGTISAVKGNINFNTALSNGNVGITGGDLLSNQVNVKAGTGGVDINVGNITGVVNVDACSAHVTADTKDLLLGAMNISGDPTYYNQGNITITNAMAPTNGQDLAIIASGNILSNGGTLNTSNSAFLGSGGSLLLVAGANFTTSDNSKSGNNDTTTTLTLTYGPGSGKGSLTGGLIDLSGGHGGKAPITAISSSGGGIGSAGDITMLAFAGKNQSSGTITLPQTLTLNSGTGGAGKSGNIMLVANAAKGTAISTGNIDSSKGALGQGVIEIDAALPNLSTPVTIMNGSITGGSINGGVALTQANVTVGNLITGGGSVIVTTTGILTFNNLDMSGHAGSALATMDGTAGGAAGSAILFGSSGVKGNNIFAFGGGGGGGSIDAANNGTNGGDGGAGGTVSLHSAAGAVSLKGMINTSGGGGGGGAGASYNGASGTAGNGGNGGTAGDVTILGQKGISVSGGVFAADGGVGGNGGSVVATSAGGGGGGGGSYGGGGGGGAGGNDLSSGGQGGGGGGGLFGGGGGSGFVTSASNLGGGGGGFQTAGVGGTAPGPNDGASGTKLLGGNGAGSNNALLVGLGGALGVGGEGGSAVGVSGQDGINVITGNSVSGGTLQLNSSFATIGSAKTPLNTLVQVLDIGLATFTVQPKDNFFINNGATVTTTFEAFGTVALTAEGNVIVSGANQSIALNAQLTAAPGTNGGIFLLQSLGANNATLKADGSGAILAAAGKNISGDNITLTSATGQIGSVANPLAINGIFPVVSANTNNLISLSSNLNLTLAKSSSGSFDFDAKAPFVLTVQGPVSSSGGNVNLSAGQGMTLESNVSAGGMVTLIETGNFNIVEKGTAINTLSLSFGIDNGSIGTSKAPFITSATNITVTGNATGNASAAFFNDTSGGAASINGTGNPLFQFNVSSISSLLSIATGTSTNASISNTSKTGGIVFTGNSGNDGTFDVRTVGGDVSQMAGTINAFSLSFESKSGSFGKGTDIVVMAKNESFNTGASASVGIDDSIPVIINASSAGNLTEFNSAQTTIAGAIKGTGFVDINCNSASDLTQNAGATITCADVTLTSQGGGNLVSNADIKTTTAAALNGLSGNVSIAGKVGSNTADVFVSAKGAIEQGGGGELVFGKTITLNGGSIATSAKSINVATPSLLLLSTSSAFVNVTGDTALQNSATPIAGNLILTSNGAVTQPTGAALSVTGITSITAKSFSQASGAVFSSMGGLLIATSGMGNAIDIEGAGLGSAVAVNLQTAPKAGVQIGSSSAVLSPIIFMQTGSLTNKGTITTTVAMPAGSLTIINPSSDLTITNTGTIGKPLDLILNSGGKMTITDNSNGFSSFQSGTSNSIIITAKGALTLPSLPMNILTVAPDSVTNNGGTITISAGSITNPVGGLSFDANALSASMGNGGNISVTVTGKQNITADFAPGWSFNANSGMTGGNGGDVTISTGGSLLVKEFNQPITNFAQMSGFSGGDTKLTGGNLAIVGTIDSSKMVAGVTPGGVFLTSNSKMPFVIDQALPLNAKSNGAGLIAGSKVSITNPGGVTIDAGNTITDFTSLTITGSQFTNNGMLPGSGAFMTVTNPSGSLTLAGTGTYQPVLFALTVNSGGDLNLGGLFNTVPITTVVAQISATGTLTLGTPSISVSGFLGGGGLIKISAKQLAYSIATPTPLILDAAGNTSGGTVDLTLTGANPVILSSSGAGNINVVTTPTSAAATSGGTVNINSGGNLSVNMSGLQTNNIPLAINSSVTLLSGGSLLVNAFNENVIGVGGTLIMSDKAKSFIVGSPTTSGIATATQINGAVLSVTNNGGDVSIGGTDFLNGLTPTSTVTISASKNIFGVSGSEAIIGGTVNLTSNGGSIGIGTKGVATNPLALQAVNLSANAGKGDVFVTQNFAGTLTLGTSSGSIFDLTTPLSLVVAGAVSGDQINLNATAGAMTIQNSIGSGKGTVSLTAGPGVVPGINQTGGTIYATILNLSADNAKNLQTIVNNIDGNISLNLTINNISSKLLTIGTGGFTADNATIGSSGPITIADIFTTTQAAINAGGAIIVAGKVNGNGGIASLNASSGGSVTETKAGAINAASVSMTSDTGSISTGKGTLAASNLAVGTAGSVALTDDISNGDIVVAPITLPVATFSLNAASAGGGNLYLNNISTSNGSISVVFTGTQLIENQSQTLSTNNGSITLQNLNTNTGTIVLQNNVDLHASATANGLGNVNLLIGAAPKNPQIGMQPANIIEAFSGKGQIFYNDSTFIFTTAVADHLNAFGRNIDINGQSSNTPSIFLLGNDTITADPPPPAAAPTISGQTQPVTAPVPISIAASAQGYSGLAGSSASFGQTQATWIAPSSSSTQAILTVPVGIYASSSLPAQAAIEDWQTNPLGQTIQAGTVLNVKRRGALRAKAETYSNKVTKLLNNEATLIAPDCNTSFESKFGRVDLQKDCLALLISTEKGLTIFNFDDRHKGSVVARVGKRTITLEPGRHLTIGSANSSGYAAINPVQFIAHRRMTSENLGNLQTFKSEFHVLSAISAVKQLRDLVNSPEPSKHQTGMHLIKTAAILNELSSGSAESFELYSENLVTAMNHQ